MQAEIETKESKKRPSYYAFPGLIRISWHALDMDEKIQFILNTVKDACRDKYNDANMHLMFTRTRTQRYVTARMAFCYITRKFAPGVTYKKIGTIIMQDHSSVIHSCTVIRNFLEIKDQEVTELITLIENKLKYE